MASVADALGNTTTFTYDAAGRQATRVDVTGAVEVMEYNTAGELVAQVDRLGQRTEIVYDSNGRIDTVADPSGRTTDHAYDTAGQLLDRTFGDGTTISYEYDDLGRRVEMVDPTGVTTYSYDANGRPVEVAAPNGTLGYSYDLAGRRTGLTYPDGTTVTYDYDAAGRLVGLTDPNTGDVDYTLDDDGRLVLTELPDGATRSFEFVSGQMVNHQDHGRTTALTYDESGRIATLSGAQNHVYTYDQAGQLLQAVQDEGTYAYTYGTRGEITSITDPDRTRTFTHNANVEIATVTDGDGETGSVSYDEAGRMTEHRDPDGTVTTYVYDARGLLVETTITTPGDGGGGPEVDPCAGLVATITGTEGDDVIQGTWQDDIIFGLGGNDIINGKSGSDIICGGEGDDTISGQSQDDTIYAGPGNDIVSGDSGADIIDGGSGDDILEGNSQADIIQGGDGDDTINGNSGPDILDGGNGDDVVDGSWQNDTCDDAEQAISCETITSNGESNDPPTDEPGTPILCNGLVATIVGTPDDDVLEGTWQDDVIVGYGGNDTINGASGADTICGGDGDDIISGQSQDDVIFGEAGNDTISGDSGADTINGGPGDDTITGDSQNDTIQGGGGNDTIDGGPGNDTLDGGNDTDSVDGSWGTDACGGGVQTRCETGLASDGISLVGTSQQSAGGAANTELRESYRYNGDRRVISVENADHNADLLWDGVGCIARIVALGTEHHVVGRATELVGGSENQHSPLGDVLRGDRPGPYGPEIHSQIGLGYRGELELLGRVHLRARELTPTLGTFTTRDPLDGVPGSVGLANPFHYADNEPIGRTDPSGLRASDAGFVGQPGLSPGVHYDARTVDVEVLNPCIIERTFECLDGVPGINSFGEGAVFVWVALIGPSTPSLGRPLSFRGIASGSRVPVPRLGGLLDDWLASSAGQRFRRQKPNGTFSSGILKSGSETIDEVIGVSGQKTFDGAEGPVTATRKFTTFDVDGFTRAFDSEVAVMERFSRLIDEQGLVSGTVDVFVPRRVCRSCRGVFEQFSARHPLFRVNVIYVDTLRITYVNALSS